MVARVRVVSEHAIGGIKRLKAVTDVFRNRKKNFAFHIIGLWPLEFSSKTSFWVIYSHFG